MFLRDDLNDNQIKEILSKNQILVLTWANGKLIVLNVFEEVEKAIFFANQITSNTKNIVFVATTNSFFERSKDVISGNFK